MHVENGRKRVEITSSFSILPTDAEAKKEKNKTVENKEVELLFRRRRQWLRAGNPRNVFIFPILSFIRLVNFSGSFIKNKKEEKKKKSLFICISIHYLATCYSCCCWCKGKPNRKETKLWRKKQNLQFKWHDENQTRPLVRPFFFSLLPPLLRTHNTNTQTFLLAALWFSSWTCENENRIDPNGFRMYIKCTNTIDDIKFFFLKVMRTPPEPQADDDNDSKSPMDWV